MNQSTENKENINSNKKKIEYFNSEVKQNELLVFQCRSLIEENRLMILSNYVASYQGNRQLAKNNTDAIQENRKVILSKAKTLNDVCEKI